jgi:hypothetical protein
MLLELQRQPWGARRGEGDPVAEEDGELEELEPVDRAEREEGVQRAPPSQEECVAPKARGSQSIEQPARAVGGDDDLGRNSAGTGREVSTKTCLPGQGHSPAASAASSATLLLPPSCSVRLVPSGGAELIRGRGHPGAQPPVALTR